MRVTFFCPLCADAGHDVSITAELVVLAGQTMVADLSGCAHAKYFGHLRPLTLDDVKRLIHAALDAFEAQEALEAQEDDNDAEPGSRTVQ